MKTKTAINGLIKMVTQSRKQLSLLKKSRDKTSRSSVHKFMAGKTPPIPRMKKIKVPAEDDF